MTKSTKSFKINRVIGAPPPNENRDQQRTMAGISCLERGGSLDGLWPRPRHEHAGGSGPLGHRRGEDTGASKEHTRARKHEQQSSRRCPASALARGAGDFGGCTGDRGGQQWLGRGRLPQLPALRAGETVLKTADRHWHGGARLGTKGGRRTRREVHGWKWSKQDERAGGGWVGGRGGQGSPRLGRHTRGGRPRAARASHSCGAGGWRPRWVGSNREPALSMSRACRVTTM